MKRSIVRRALAVAAAVTLVGCSGDPTGVGDLSKAELEDMMDAMDALGAFSGAFRIVDASENVAFAVIPVNDQVSCPNGGSLTQSGSVTVDEETFASSSSITTDYNDCRASSSSGRVWTFNGDPSITMNMTSSMNLTTGAFTMSGTQSGGLRFSSDAGGGTCDVSLTFSASQSGTGELTGTVSGTICGESVSHSLTE